MKRKYVLLTKISVSTVLVLIVLGYGLFQARNLITGPKITITAPTNGENLATPLVTIAGLAANITHISLNDRPIFVDKQGNFSEKLLVSPGYTIIKLAAQDKFGRTTQKLLEFNYTSSKTFSVINNATAGTTTSTTTLSFVH